MHHCFQCVEGVVHPISIWRWPWWYFQNPHKCSGVSEVEIIAPNELQKVPCACGVIQNLFLPITRVCIAISVSRSSEVLCELSLECLSVQCALAFHVSVFKEEEHKSISYSTSLIGVLMYLLNSWGHADICDCLKPILNIVLHSQASMAVSVFQLCRPATGKLHTTLCIKYNYNAGMTRTSLHSLGSLWPVQVVSFSVTSPNTCIFHSFCSLVCLLGAASPGILQPCSRQRCTSSYCVVFYPC